MHYGSFKIEPWHNPEKHKIAARNSVDRNREKIRVRNRLNYHKYKKSPTWQASHKEYTHKYYEEHKQHESERKRLHYQQNRERILAQHKAYRIRKNQKEILSLSPLLYGHSLEVKHEQVQAVL
jgi:hypothetical protein